MESIDIEKKDMATTDPSRFTVKDYVDIVEKQKYQFDAFFCLKFWRPKPNLHPEATKFIADSILESPRMKDVIHQLLLEGHNGVNSYENIVVQIKTILEEMGHTYSLGTIRVIGFFLAKLLRNLYQGVAINNSAVLKLSKAMSEGPVLILPTHRSYADFLLISYLCYTMDIPLPVIAAGMDFKGMKFVNRVLQNAGAFYIRRSFGHDQLYWAVVSQYIQYHIKNFQAPIEFFLEGTRSRNGKSLPPKIGLLSMALEPYFRGDVPDIKICTVSITYERTLEEKLYAWEALGVPKPRESTSGFLSAVGKIRGQNYGQIYVNVSDPISVRDHISKRTEPNWNTPSFRFTLNEYEKSRIHSLAWNLVSKQQKDAITPVSAVLMSALSVNKQLNIDQLVEYVVLFNSVLKKYGTPCLVQDDTVVQAIKDCLDAHKLIIFRASNEFFSCQPAISEGADIQILAADRLVLQQYTNQLLGPLINVAVFGIIEAKCARESSDIINESKFFAKYFKDEFILITSYTQNDIASLNDASNPMLKNVLGVLLQPFLESFYIILHLIAMGFSTIKEIQLQYRNVVSTILAEGASSFLEILAIDKISRHVLNLVTNGHLCAVKTGNNTSYQQMDDISPIIVKIETYLDERLKRFMVSHRQKTVLIQSHL
ncbi:dihydroxyacetone phosphate acyltransferase-like isoform X2 [Daphnia pulex]|uniref:dihydroxyacetone phosphate acyltransferase-like isoform X2 n=1 Tax=Daphnia pulex TaxID=6669 RepID=UPI001EDCE118|nr:dihydroxyacetone phosphate acyltransferase-like isoform X2 [Daphnia pulex]